MKTSYKALIEEMRSGRISRRQNMILEKAKEMNKPFTARLMLRWLRFSDPNAVRPRITELCDAGQLVVTGTTRCSVTNKSVSVFRARTEEEYQAFLAEIASDENLTQSELPL